MGDENSFEWSMRRFREGGDLLFDRWPAIDVYETDNSLIVVCEIAGMKMPGFQIAVEDDDLTIRGMRDEIPIESKTTYHCYEIDYGFFERRFRLPEYVSAERIKTTYQNGFLKVRLSKKAVSREIPNFYREIRRIQEGMNLLFDQLGLERWWRPPIDMYETNDSLIIICEIAGMHEDDFEIAIKSNELTISGERDEIPIEGKMTYHCMEIDSGPFLRKFGIPEYVNTHGIKATYQNGFLKVKLSKST
jgi:HSP20 family protein